MRKRHSSDEMSFGEIFIGYILSVILVGIYTILSAKYGWNDAKQIRLFCYLTFIPGINSLIVALGMLMLVFGGIVYGFGSLGDFFAGQLVR